MQLACPTPNLFGEYPTLDPGHLRSSSFSIIPTTATIYLKDYLRYLGALLRGYSILRAALVARICVR